MHSNFESSNYIFVACKRK